MPEGESGSSTAVAFALAGVLFIGAISTVLVYTNDRIPPPARTRPHQEYGAEAHALLQSLVLGCGSAPWDSTAGAWTESAVTTSANNVPGLLNCTTGASPAARCKAPGVSYCLDFARIAKLEGAGPPASDGTYNYTELRQILGLVEAERHFRIVIVDLNASEEVLLDYGQPIPGRTATQPATSYLELQHRTGPSQSVPGARDRHLLRVAVHVFHS